MNKTAIKNFAVWARKKLIADITYKAGLLGVSEKGIAQPLPQSTRDLQFFDIGTRDYAQVAGAEITQRNALVKAVQERAQTSDYKTAFKAVIEEVAYTWFNRLIAIRFMEVNDYLPSRIRVLSSENPAKNEPDFVTTPFDTDLDFSMAEQEQILRLKDENKLDELFRMLFIKQCNKLHEILPELFEETSHYTELLLSISFTDMDGIVYHLVHDIPEDDFNVEKEGQIEIIGWLYQYYNIEPKDETFALLKKNVKITKERIPAATQLFTPDWIVRYMVENSLGRLWLERMSYFLGDDQDARAAEALRNQWKYYLDEAEQEPDVRKQLDAIVRERGEFPPAEIKVIDPCMGSGHILVYCFDVLMQIYESQGYTQRESAQSILENNLFGLDIDKRAAQLAYFAVMMKARQYDRRIFTRGIKPHVYAIEESNGFNRSQLKCMGGGLSTLEKNNAINQIHSLLDALVDAKEYGSILNIENYDWALMLRFAEGEDDSDQISLDTIGLEETRARLLALLEVGQTMAQKYHVVVTNPPYMGASGMSSALSKFVKDNYPDSKSDLFAVFIERCGQMTAKNCYQAMITQHVWMFLGSYEKLRVNLLGNDTVNMAHLGPRAFEEIGGEVVQTASFVIRKSHCSEYKGTYCRLVVPTSQDGKEKMFLSGTNRFVAKQSMFANIPGSPVAYWASKNAMTAFTKYNNLGKVANPRLGFATGDNDRFMRLWFEPAISNIGFGLPDRETAQKTGLKWFPTNKGGTYRKWYGNFELVVNWENDGWEIRNFKDEHGKLRSRPQNLVECFSDGVSWTVICNHSSFRYSPVGMLYNNKGPILGHKGDKNNYLYLGTANSCVTEYFLQLLSPTLGFESGYVSNVPYNIPGNRQEEIQVLVQKCITISKNEWDSFETSWDFLAHPLVLAAEVPDLNGGHKATLADAYAKWEALCEKRFNQLKANEEELNRIFIEIYGLQDELTPEVEDKDITVRRANLQREIKSLLSYAVGCMFGRYSTYKEGLLFAGEPYSLKAFVDKLNERPGTVSAEEVERAYLHEGVVLTEMFYPDEDNCIPITDEEYFEDDIVGLLCAWLKKVYGEDTLEANLDFIAGALGNKGATSREVIRNYFLNDFMKDHIKVYQKRPIYWLFDSGKQNGFKALVYMHRWTADTVGNLRVEYLHRMQRVYESEIIRMQEVIDNSRDSREVSAANKRKEKLQKQLKETKDYDAMLAHIALSRIEIDLDDGVKVNYEKVQTGRDGQKLPILAKL